MSGKYCGIPGAGGADAEGDNGFCRTEQVLFASGRHPLVWVVRSEMMRGSFDQLNQYLAQLVKEPNMKEIIVARLDGRIVAATNKKREGTLASSAFPVDMLRVEAITVTTLENGDLLVAAPVLGLNARLGTLISCSFAVSFFVLNTFLVFNPESVGMVWAGTSPKPLVIGRHPRHGSGTLPASDAFLAVDGVQ